MRKSSLEICIRVERGRTGWRGREVDDLDFLVLDDVVCIDETIRGGE